MVNNEKGFTLMEMLIALMLFSLLSIAGYQLISGMVRSSETALQHTDRLGEMQELFALLESDIRHALIAQKMTPPALASFQLKGFNGTTLLRLARTPDFPSLSGAGHLPELVEWRMSDEGLRRLVRKNAFSAEERDVFIIASHFPLIESLSLRFYQNGRWLQAWTETGERPAAVEIRITRSGYGSISKTILTGNVR